ncbi:MAG: alanine racemase [Deltaproteobacteria bacterium]|nr:MAG: alanine racemase [Deltaproteobacteria bacterium]
MNKYETFAEINLSKIGQNISNLKKLAGSENRLMAIVKADGYGHGAVETAKAALKNGADFIGVARNKEALKIRENNISCPVLTLGCPWEDSIKDSAENNIDISVYDYKTAKMISAKAKEINKNINVHIKVDTGMGRVGIYGTEKEIFSEIIKIMELSNINPVGIFTHFATADEKDSEYALLQMSKFQSVLDILKKNNIDFQYKHCANSAALMNIKQSRNFMVRPGIAIYGLYPSLDINRNIVKLQPAMSLKARIVQVKNVKKGSSVSYGRTWFAKKDSRLAIIAIGYADGFQRLLSSKTYVLINGEKAPLRGTICMDMCVADITDIKNVTPGEYATIIGKDRDNEISADYHAKQIGTINYEIVSSITSRVKRLYVYD